MELNLKINGQKTKLSCHSMERLLDVIREKANLTGTKEGCGEGECGACSVMLNGKLVNSCLVPAAQAQNSEITTIEGIGNKNELSQLQKAFLECGGAQCGICTPGMIVAAEALLKRNPKPTQEEIREGISGNLCRCTGYTKIFESIVRAMQ